MAVYRVGMTAVVSVAVPSTSSLPCHRPILLRVPPLCCPSRRPRNSWVGRRASFTVSAPLTASSTDEVAAVSPSGDSSSGIENLVIIGSGPAGYTAAIYAARANLKPVVFEGYQVGGVPGGQLMTTTEVENFPGFPEGISGPDLMDRYISHATCLNAFALSEISRNVKCHSLIIATGANAKRLRLPREDEFWSRGISACAICDGASPLFKGQVLAVVGGGDTATEEALYLTKYARHVHLLVRKSHLRASKAMQDRLVNLMQ
ncbi:hypothetical protein B296_00047004 [Ensete ventricosum]|uniref:FAD/NAD(P)-binding domain-containing protein n=1 Tax=Ensete ventricosum TaxID=4639 RepID=A0A426Y8B2_ENSVE|nr:hypothetical protein B296_00047004 [Ensete ventricosum]